MLIKKNTLLKLEHNCLRVKHAAHNRRMETYKNFNAPENLLAHHHRGSDQGSGLEYIQASRIDAKRDHHKNSRRITQKIRQDCMFGDLSLYLSPTQAFYTQVIQNAYAS